MRISSTNKYETARSFAVRRRTTMTILCTNQRDPAGGPVTAHVQRGWFVAVVSVPLVPIDPMVNTTEDKSLRSGYHARIKV